MGCLSWVIQEQWQRYIESALYSALKSKYGARRESRFTRYSKLYVTLCLLTTSISLRDPLSKITKSWLFKCIKINSTTINMFTMNLRTSVKFTLFILTSMGRRISLKCLDGIVSGACLRYTPDYLTPNICSRIKLAAIKMMFDAF